MNITTPGARFTRVGFGDIDHRYTLLLRLELKELLEPIVCPGQHRPSRLATDFPLRFGHHVGRLESWQKDQSVVVR